VPPITDAKRRLVERLKRVGSATVPELAHTFALTDTAVRQHLEALEGSGLVERTSAPAGGRGRPPSNWRLTPLADDLFPDRHDDLTVELITGIRAALGDDALERVIDVRTANQERAYRAALADPTTTSVRVRVRRLAALRSDEGYLAEAIGDGDAMVLVEHHCPVCDAATVCQGLCRGELELFRRVLGDDVTVERTSHVLGGDDRCAYRISPR
jgi:predicted ArsR family transcriptional regulator